MSFIATASPDAAKVFYTDVMGLKLLEVSPFALVFGDGGHLLRVQIVAELSPASHTVHGWQVTNIASAMEDLAAKGVQFLRFDQLPQDHLGVWTTPDGHQIAWFRDPDGNTLSLSQMFVS
jgi:catechol 2,3-dioxygenase-like lactoylglutathione lyase family enzyme